MVDSSDSIFKRILISIFVLVICRLGSYVPIPGVNPAVVSNFLSGGGSNFLGMFNLLSGGALGRLAIFSLSVMPYILSSIVMQLIFIPIKNSAGSGKDQEWRKKSDVYARLLAFILCFFQGSFVLMGLQKLAGGDVSVFVDNSYLLRFIGVCSIAGGSMILMWLGDKITSCGVGNGLSLIIFAGIVSELPSAIFRLFALRDSNSIGVFGCFFTFLLFFMMLFLVVFVELSVRKIVIHYPRRQSGHKVYGGGNSHIPLKVNMSGVIPPIFSNAVMMFPLMIAGFYSDVSIAQSFKAIFSYGSLSYILLSAVFIIFFSFFYSSFAFDVAETSSMLKKSGGFIPGRRPGIATADYLSSVMKKMTCVGSVYLAVICIVPELFRYYYSVPFMLSGASLLIMVSVVMDTISQVQVHSFSSRYDALIKKSRLWG